MARIKGPTPKVEAEAEALFWRLHRDPMTLNEISAEFGWSYPTAVNRLSVARGHIAEVLDAAIPRAIQEDGYLYRVVNADHVDSPALQRSTTVAIEDSMTRLKTIHRVAQIGLKVLDGRTVQGKAAKIMEFRVRQALEELALLDA